MLHLFWISYYGAVLCRLFGHRKPTKRPYIHMPNKFYVGCSRCESNIEHVIYGDSAFSNWRDMYIRRAIFEIVFWSLGVALFLYLGYLSFNWF